MGLLVWEILFHSFLHYSTWTNDSCCATCCDFTDEVALKLPFCLITYWVWINLYLHLNSLAGLLAPPPPLCLMGNGGLSSMIDMWLPYCAFNSSTWHTFQDSSIISVSFIYWPLCSEECQHSIIRLYPKYSLETIIFKTQVGKMLQKVPQ